MKSGGLGFTLALKDLSSSKGNNQVAREPPDFKKIQAIDISLQKAAKLLGIAPKSDAVDKLMAEHFPGFTLAPEYREKIVESQSDVADDLRRIRRPTLWA